MHSSIRVTTGDEITTERFFIIPHILVARNKKTTTTTTTTTDTGTTVAHEVEQVHNTTPSH